jgi:membrane protease YdiL (CAAX protease family)
MVPDHIRHAGANLPYRSSDHDLFWMALAHFRLVDRKATRVAGALSFILLFIALGEEPGWRGFALPHLQIKYSPLLASLILAPVWALWHLPLIGNEFPLPIVGPFLLSLFGGTFTLTWVFNGTKGSVLLPMLFHATINSVGAGLIFPLFSGAALVALWWIYGFVWLCFGLGALLFWANKPVNL